MLTPQSGRQVREFGTRAPSRVLAAPQIVRLLSNAKSQPMYQTAGDHYTALYDHSCSNRIAHSQHCLLASVAARELNLKYARATWELNPGPFAPAAESVGDEGGGDKD